MGKRSGLFLHILLILSAIPFVGRAQVIVTGMVADSTTMLSLANVNIGVYGNSFKTVSDIRGYFPLQVSTGDTLVFSRSDIAPEKLRLAKSRNQS